ncbi:MAG: hypothetical protein AAGB51_08035 [Planctomycetota bacterium]
MTGAQPNSRAFVTPLVLALILFVSIMLGAMISRHTQQAYAVHRHTSTYQRVHAERGLLALADAVRDSIAPADLARHVVEKGSGGTKPALIAEVELTRRHTFKMYAQEAQGTISLDVISPEGRVTSTDVELALNLRDQMGLQASGDDLFEALASHVRTQGPREVSPFTASREVLRAVLTNVVAAAPTPAPDPTDGSLLPDREEAAEENDEEEDGELSDRAVINPEVEGYLEEVLRVRSGAAWARSAIYGERSMHDLATDLGMTGQVHAQFGRMFTASPTLYLARVELVENGEAPRVFEGLFLSGGATEPGETIGRNTSFLSWSEIDEESDQDSPARRGTRGRASRAR